jgi:hypothetical protein
MHLSKLVLLLLCGLWPISGLAQDAREIDRAVGRMVHLCLTGVHTEVMIGSATGIFELLLRSIDTRGNIRAEFYLSRSNAGAVQERIANAITRLKPEKAPKVSACLEPVYSRLEDVVASDSPIKERGPPRSPIGVQRHPRVFPYPATAPPSAPQLAAVPPSEPQAAPPPQIEPQPAPSRSSEPQDQFERIRAVGRELQSLPLGKVYYFAPNEMKVSEKRNVTARVGINVSDDVLRAGNRPGDQSGGGVLRVSHEMIATLSGPGFAITPITAEKQTVAEGFPTVWEWEIEAKMAGSQELEATLYALVPVGASATDRQRIDSYTQKINVSVKPRTWSEWLTSAREGIDTAKAIVIALASMASFALGWLGISLKRRTRPSAETAIRHKRKDSRGARSASDKLDEAEHTEAAPRRSAGTNHRVPHSPHFRAG